MPWKAELQHLETGEDARTVTSEFSAQCQCVLGTKLSYKDTETVTGIETEKDDTVSHHSKDTFGGSDSDISIHSDESIGSEDVPIDFGGKGKGIEHMEEEGSPDPAEHVAVAPTPEVPEVAEVPKVEDKDKEEGMGMAMAAAAVFLVLAFAISR